MSIIKLLKKKTTVAEDINTNLLAEKGSLVELLRDLAVDDEMYETTLDRIETIDGLLIKKEKKKFKADPVVVAAFISTLGFVGVSLASMKYEDDWNIIQHTAGKTAMNKIGRWYTWGDIRLFFFFWKSLRRTRKWN